MLIDLYPTFIINAFIILKELTMNQFAWNKAREYKEGKILGLIDTNFLQWFAISEDPKDYLAYLKEWSR